MTLTFGICKKKSFSWLQVSTLVSKATIASEKSTVFPFPYKCPSDRIWPECKIGQGQPRAIIWTNLIELESLKLHIKFQVHRPFSSWEELQRFLGFFYHIWKGRPSWSCDPDIMNKLLFPYPMEAPHVIWLQLAQRFQRKCRLKISTLTTDHCLSYKLPWRFRLWWAKKYFNMSSAENFTQSAKR